jgi:nicotinate-nucleotide pyrophosphorylase (carboxylating)
MQAQEYLKQQRLDIRIEIEARTIRDVEIILETGGAFRILLDNFSVEDLREAVRFIQGRVETEASGGIHPGNVLEYASTGVDYLSMGALTHQIQSIDLSLKAC